MRQTLTGGVLRDFHFCPYEVCCDSTILIHPALHDADVILRMPVAEVKQYIHTSFYLENCGPVQ